MTSFFEGLRPFKMRLQYLCIFLFLIFCSVGAVAADFNFSGVDVSFQENDQQSISKAFQVLLLLSVLSLAPALVVILTAFTRIIIVLAMLRHAFGMPNTPPNVVLVSLAIFLTIFTMMPVIEKIEEQALLPYQAGEISTEHALKEAMVPLREFMIRQTREKDLVTILELANQPKPEKLEDIKSTVLIPAFMISELQSAFKIGFILFIPFLLIDLVAASILMAMGMIMVPPLTISLPIKILMFVLIDGWVLVTQALVNSFI
jgi:flagellar biosynthetic protein FliP